MAASLITLAFVGDLWQSTLGGLWDSTEAFRTQYFDLSLMGDELDPVLEGFLVTIKLSLAAGILSLFWGLVLAVLRQLPGRPLAPVRWVTIAYIDVFRGIPLLLVLLLLIRRM